MARHINLKFYYLKFSYNGNTSCFGQYFVFRPWATVHGGQEIESAQKIHATRSWWDMHVQQVWWAWPLWFRSFGPFWLSSKLPKRSCSQARNLIIGKASTGKKFLLFDKSRLTVSRSCSPTTHKDYPGESPGLLPRSKRNLLPVETLSMMRSHPDHFTWVWGEVRTSDIHSVYHTLPTTWWERGVVRLRILVPNVVSLAKPSQCLQSFESHESYPSSYSILIRNTIRLD